MTEPELTQEHRDYLVSLRDSGITNMWGASPYIAEEFNISEKDAKSILVQWIEEFK